MSELSPLNRSLLNDGLREIVGGAATGRQRRNPAADRVAESWAEQKPSRAEAAVQSVDRALLVLEILATLGQAGVTEIAAELGVHKSTVSRLIAVLESRGYVEQASERGKYRLGFAIARLARASSGHLDLVKLSQDVCDALAPDVGETTNLAILDEARIVNIVEAIGPEQITLRTWVGQSCPAHATSSGKVLLAGLEPADVRARLRRHAGVVHPATPWCRSRRSGARAGEPCASADGPASSRNSKSA